MNIFKRLIIKLIFPEIYNTLDLEQPLNLNAYDQLYAARREYLVIAKEYNAQAVVMGTVCDERDLATQTLMSLVAQDDSNQWTTVMDADTVLPQEAQDYLHALVKRA